MTAMTPLTMAAISDRFMLGLGASGPQFVGLARSTVQGALADEEALNHQARACRERSDTGTYHDAARRTGERCACRSLVARHSGLSATLGPASLEYTGAAADGWLGTSFTPEHADAHFDYLRRGAASTGRKFTDIDIQAGGTVAFGDDLDALVEPLKPAMAFTLGAMGSATTNFYNDAFKRGGWEAAGQEVQRLWVAGKRPEAIAKVPAEMVIQANLLGDTEAVKSRIRAYKNAGVTTLRVAPEGRDLADKLTTLGRHGSRAVRQRGRLSKLVRRSGVLTAARA
jgi:alkanesulfonate monooxygenase SsuD/methylene tetrahydromethanopterin reductase-like flavin-dependent oxidoreductase (luciferase family)